MSVRASCRAAELTDGAYVLNGGVVQRLEKVLHVGGQTTVIEADGESWRVPSSKTINLATAHERILFEHDRDRLAVVEALAALGRRILAEALPVPPIGRTFVVSFDLADDADLQPWAKSLSSRPQRGTSRPMVSAEVEGVEVYVYGPGTSGEFGPELADAPSVEHRDSVGAFPVVAPRSPLCDEPKWGDELGCPESGDGMHRCRSVGTHHLRPRQHWCKCGAMVIGPEPKPERDGFAPPTGHAAVLPADALQHDRYNGGTEA